ncbi:lipopolysaccharide transport periplasmic protein LptA [Paracoccus sp. (in: a-proteobacteria)]|uniref:lipopolysaccharide transport periplasmic protein LptA n=1 Tax=Paracoccus sp. TaxID=267 RepID=UPI0028986057|nr:lipopolysaccharide transport periplasmic protein LptA [Paracoccus sp. (in: a-proteobacteria)]
MSRLLRAACTALLVLMPLAAAPALAQSVKFGQRADPKSAVEVNSEQLSVDQKTGHAVFSGNVVVGQGDMRLSADKVTVIYAQGPNRKIERLEARGNVTLVNGPDAAEAQAADYSVGSGKVLLTGDVILTQGPSVLAGEKVEVDLATGSAQVSGRVRTVLQPGSQ